MCMRPCPATPLLLLACVHGALLCAGEPPHGDEPILVPKEAFLFGQIPSVPRLIERYRESPYAKMLATTWGQDLGETMQLNRPSQQRFWVMIQDLQQVGLVFLKRGKDESADSDLMGVVLRERPGATGVQPWLSTKAHPEPSVVEITTTIEGKVTKKRIEEPVPPELVLTSKPPFYLCTGPGLETPPSLADGILQPVASDYCVEVNANPDRITRLLPAALAEMVKGNASRLQLGVRLTPRGVEERTVSVLSGQELADWQKFKLPRLDFGILRGLPATTIWAVLWRFDPAFTPRALRLPVFPNTPEGMVLKPLDKLFTTYGLPEACDLLEQIDGHLLVYTEAVGPAIVYTVQVDMPRGLGEKAEKFLASYLKLTRGENGVLTSGIRGWFRCQAAYAGGQLTLTTHPDGLKAVQERKPGFLEQKEIQEALRCVPDPTKNDLLLLGLGRSGEWWSRLIGGLMRKPQAAGTEAAPASELEQNVTADLRNFLSFSYDYACLHTDGYEVRGEGLLGGPKLITFASILASSLVVTKVRAPDGSVQRVSWLEMIRSGDLFLFEKAEPDGGVAPEP